MRPFPASTARIPVIDLPFLNTQLGSSFSITGGGQSITIVLEIYLNIMQTYSEIQASTFKISFAESFMRKINMYIALYHKLFLKVIFDGIIITMDKNQLHKQAS